MRRWLWLALIAGCSSGEGGGGGSGSGKPFPSFGSPGADRGAGLDFGAGTDSTSGVPRGSVATFGRCYRTDECAHGTCIREKSAKSTEAGFCLTRCGGGPISGAASSPTPLPVETCASGEDCVQAGNFAFCLRPCRVDADCPSVTGSKMRCDNLDDGSERWCHPGGSTTTIED
jgi:hypothetical protein